jgi:adenine/guanine phosphoribosyltransferase-like PRPP-binding protein
MNHSPYLQKSINQKERKETIDYCVNTLEYRIEMKEIPDFDAIAVSGVSGLLIGPSVADRLGKKLIVVRKDADRKNSHALVIVEADKFISDYLNFTYIVIDDLIDSGSTLNRIIDKINYRYPYAKCVGVYCYAENRPRFPHTVYRSSTLTELTYLNEFIFSAE